MIKKDSSYLTKIKKAKVNDSSSKIITNESIKNAKQPPQRPSSGEKTMVSNKTESDNKNSKGSKLQQMKKVPPLPSKAGMKPSRAIVSDVKSDNISSDNENVTLNEKPMVSTNVSSEELIASDNINKPYQGNTDKMDDSNSNIITANESLENNSKGLPDQLNGPESMEDFTEDFQRKYSFSSGEGSLTDLMGFLVLSDAENNALTSISSDTVNQSKSEVPSSTIIAPRNIAEDEHYEDSDFDAEIDNFVNVVKNSSEKKTEVLETTNNISNNNNNNEEDEYGDDFIED